MVIEIPYAASVTGKKRIVVGSVLEYYPYSHYTPTDRHSIKGKYVGGVPFEWIFNNEMTRNQYLERMDDYFHRKVS